MTRYNLFKFHAKWMLSLLLLPPCYGFADNNGTDGYPDEVKCIVDSYFSGFSKIDNDIKNYTSRWGWFRGEAKKANIQIKSINTFFLERESGTTENGTVSKQRRFRSFLVDILTFETPTDVNKFIDQMVKDLDFLNKPPGRYIIHKKNLILLRSASTDSEFVIQKAVCEIMQTCFECNIDIKDIGGASLDEIKDCCKRSSK